MAIGIYFSIIILYLVLFFWIWNSTQGFESKQKRVVYIVVGTLVMLFITFILFSISTNGINYTNEKIFSATKKISILLFTPINGYLTLPFIAKRVSDIKYGEADDEKTKRRIIIQMIIIIALFIAEIVFLKDFQNGIANK